MWKVEVVQPGKYGMEQVSFQFYDLYEATDFIRNAILHSGKGSVLTISGAEDAPEDTSEDAADDVTVGINVSIDVKEDK